MTLDLSNVVLSRIDSSMVELLVKYRIDYLKELQGEQEVSLVEKTKEQLEIFFREALEQGRVVAYIASINGEPISFGAMIIKKIPGDFCKPIYLEGDILNMYTVPAARKQGVSAMVLQKLLEYASGNGISKVSLHTTKAGERLYRKFGFGEPIYPVLEFLSL